jgi:hypothetical protein
VRAHTRPRPRVHVAAPLISGVRTRRVIRCVPVQVLWYLRPRLRHTPSAGAYMCMQTATRRGAAAASRSHAQATAPCPPVREQIKGAKTGRSARFPRCALPSSVLFTRTSAAPRGAELRRVSTQGRRCISILAKIVVSPSFPPPLLHPSDILCSGLVHSHGTSPASSHSGAAGHPYRH